MHATRVFWGAGALGSALLALLHPAFRAPDGSLAGTFSIPLTVGVAAAVVALTWSGRRRAAGGWTALAVLGQGAVLQLMTAGSSQTFTHLRTVESLAADPPVGLFALLALQAGAVAWGIAARRDELLSWVRSNIGAGRAVVLAGAVFALGATVTRNPVDFGVELVVVAVFQLILLGNLVLVGTSLPADDAQRTSARARALAPLPAADASGTAGSRWVQMMALFAFLASVVLSVVVYQRHPHVPDELAYLIHARTFAAGQLWLPAPPVPRAFVVDLMVFEPSRWYSTFAPGWPAMLALGTLIGVPWLVNPILAGLNILLVDRLVGRLTDRRTALLTVTLMAASPWYLFLGMSFMSHQFTLACALTGALAVAKLRDGAGLGWALAGGAGIGMVGLCRPLDGLAVAIPLGIWALLSGGARGVVRAGALALFTAGIGSLTFVYNRLLTGDPKEFAVMRFWEAVAAPGVNALGFGPGRGFGPNGLDPLAGHGPVDVILNANLNLTQMNAELFGWGIASLLPALFLLLVARKTKVDLALLGVATFVVAVQSSYWFSGGADFGARYWFLTMPIVAYLTARGLRELEGRLGSGGGGRLVAVLGALTLIGLAVYVPWRGADKYHDYRGMEAEIRVLAEDMGFDGALVLVRGNRHPDYASAAAYNPLDLEGSSTIYAWDRGPQDTDRLLWAFRDRVVWAVEGPTITGAGFRVTEGPIEARILLERRGIQGPPPPLGRPIDIRDVRTNRPEGYETP